MESYPRPAPLLLKQELPWIAIGSIPDFASEIPAAYLGEVPNRFAPSLRLMSPANSAEKIGSIPKPACPNVALTDTLRRAPLWPRRKDFHRISPDRIRP
jgi:hypothetical protein